MVAPAHTFSAGLAVSVSSVGDTGPGLDSDLTVAVGAVAGVFSDPGGTVAVPVLDLNGVQSQVRSGPTGHYSPFGTNAALPDEAVWLDWGGDLPLVRVPSDQSLNAGPVAAEALSTARAAVTTAANAMAVAATGGGGGRAEFFIAADDAAAADAPPESFILIRRAV